MRTNRFVVNAIQPIEYIFCQAEVEKPRLLLDNCQVTTIVIHINAGQGLVINENLAAARLVNPLKKSNNGRFS
jgi:hypothetical protein